MSQTDKATLSGIAGVGAISYVSWVGQLGLEVNVGESEKIDLTMGSAFNLETAGPTISYKHLSNPSSGNYHGLFGVSALAQSSWANNASLSEAVDRSYYGGTLDIGLSNRDDTLRFLLSSGAIGNSEVTYPLVILGVQGLLDLI